VRSTTVLVGRLCLAGAVTRRTARRHNPCLSSALNFQYRSNVRLAGTFPTRIHRIDLSNGQWALWKELMPADPAAVIDVNDIVGRVLVTPDGRQYVYSYIRWLGEIEVLEGLK
jgi:hypothetical protein